ncbi:MAG: hypothetical protein JKY22_00700, partial [Flavobacteriaceae bacterium]|nr:hypothetical protein [Flavobacteriaceae bacterium]
MKDKQPTIARQVASQRDLRAAFALKQMDESGLVEKEPTYTQAHGYDVLTMDKSMAPVLCALHLHLRSWDHQIFSGVSDLHLRVDKVIPGTEYIPICKELAKTCDPVQLSNAVIDLLRTSSDDEKKDIIGGLRFASHDPGVRWFLRTYLDSKPISWPESITAMKLHNELKKIMMDKTIPPSEKAKYLMDPSNIPVKSGDGEVVTIKCLKKSDLKKFKKIPCFDECQDLLVSCDVPLLWVRGAPARTRDDIFFVTHKWDGLEPDPHKLIYSVAEELDDKFLFWIDYCCVDQKEIDFEQIVSAKSTIPHVR